MKRTFLKALSAALLIAGLGTPAVYAENETVSQEEVVPMYRLYNPNSGEHFYTASAKEQKTLVSAGWRPEGIGWRAPKTGDPVYRLYNPNAGDHHYTTSEAEKDALVKAGWNYESIGWYSDPDQGVALYRQYNPNAKSGSHNYTTNKDENDNLVKAGWKGEGVGWYGVEGGVDAASDISGKYGIYLNTEEKAYVYYDNDNMVKNTTVFFYGRNYTVDANGHIDVSDDRGMKAGLEALNLCTDGQEHPYSNTVRWGPSYDCSSFSLSCYKQSGTNIGAAGWTGNMEEALLAVGFTSTTYRPCLMKPGTLYCNNYTDTSIESASAIYVGQLYSPQDNYWCENGTAHQWPGYIRPEMSFRSNDIIGPYNPEIVDTAEQRIVYIY